LSCFSFIILARPPFSTLFPYTTLFRSGSGSWLAYFDGFLVELGAIFGQYPGGELGWLALLHTQDDIRHPRPSVLAIVLRRPRRIDRKSTRLNSSHLVISYAVLCLKKKK